jgi:hypothetical protein
LSVPYTHTSVWRPRRVAPLLAIAAVADAADAAAMMEISAFVVVSTERPRCAALGDETSALSVSVGPALLVCLAELSRG